MSLAKNKPAIAGLLLTVAFIWGSAFVIMKDALKYQDVNSFLACRFIIATCVLIALKPKALRKIDRKFLFKGVTIGLLLGGGYIFQTFGLTMTTVAKTGFITGLYAIFVPIFAAILFRKNITGIQWIAVALSFIGLMILSFKGLSIGVGEFLVFISALLFAFHIIALGEWSSSMDTYALTIVQLATSAVLTYAASMKSGFHLPDSGGGWRAVIYTALFATAFAFIIQTWAQAHMTSTKVAVILTMEVVFAAIFSIIFGGESLTLQSAIGGILVVGAMYLIVIKESK